MLLPSIYNTFLSHPNEQVRWYKNNSRYAYQLINREPKTVNRIFPDKPDEESEDKIGQDVVLEKYAGFFHFQPQVVEKEKRRQMESILE